MLKGIDISYWQGKNFKIADHSPDFVIIRGGYGLTPDSCANNFIAQAESLGIPWGVYWYSYALTIKGGTAEAVPQIPLIERIKQTNVKSKNRKVKKPLSAYQPTPGLALKDRQSVHCATVGFASCVPTSILSREQ